MLLCLGIELQGAQQLNTTPKILEITFITNQILVGKWVFELSGNLACQAALQKPFLWILNRTTGRLVNCISSSLSMTGCEIPKVSFIIINLSFLQWPKDFSRKVQLHQFLVAFSGDFYSSVICLVVSLESRHVGVLGHEQDLGRRFTFSY